MNVRVDLNIHIRNGTEVVFRSPVDCSQVTGLIVYYPENNGTGSKEFAFADAHGNNVGDIDHLFAENVVVKVILDVTTSMAFVQNADTNAYLEGRFKDIDNTQHQIDDDLRDIHSFNVSVRGQSFTPEQQAQARENIGAVGYAYVDAEIGALHDDIEGIERDLTGVKNNIIGIEQTTEENEAKIAKNSEAIDELQKTGGGGSKDAVLYTEQKLTLAQQAQARENIGAAVYYHTTREEIGKAHDEINTEYI